MRVITLIIIGLLIGWLTAWWVDQSFLEKYASHYGYSMSEVRLIDNKGECYEYEWEDEQYGVCVLVRNTPTDAELN